MSEFIFKMPDIGEGIVEAEIVEWHVQVGDDVKEDAPLADVMTDKATVEITSPVSGRVMRTGTRAGEKIAIGADFVVFSAASDASVDPAKTNEVAPSEDKSSSAAVLKVRPDSDEPASSGSEKSVTEISVAAKPRLRLPPAMMSSENVLLESNSAKVLASPAVRKQAQSIGVPLTMVQGSGPKGRILKSDLPKEVTGKSASDISAAGSQTNVKQIVGLRRLIAERMSEAKRNIPHFTYVEEVDVTELESTRQFLNANRQSSQPKLSLLHFLLVGICRSVVHWPQCNAHYNDADGVLTEYSRVHLGVATMTEAGLLVPVIHNADRLDLWEIAIALNCLADQARAGTLPREDLSGSTITTTSLGSLAGITTTPIVNRPETAIIGPNKMTEKLVMQAGSIVCRNVMNISSSFDHRIVDGYDAAQFIQHLRGQLENPAALFV